MQPEIDISGFEFKTVPTVSITEEDQRMMLRLFDACYREANHSHLGKSLAHLLYVTFAWDEAGNPAGVVSEGRWLTCGRMAHPGAFRLMASNPTCLPRPGRTPTPWQQEVGQAVADIYGVENFDPETFVCVGSGKPIGYPVIELEAEEDEWEVFKPVDRDRGDALLGIAWTPTAPEDW